jgi:hypothetical protein
MMDWTTILLPLRVSFSGMRRSILQTPIFIVYNNLATTPKGKCADIRRD